MMQILPETPPRGRIQKASLMHLIDSHSIKNIEKNKYQIHKQNVQCIEVTQQT